MDYLSADDNENRYKTRSLDLLARCIKYSNMYKYWDNPVANTRLLFDVLLLVFVLFNTPKVCKQYIYIVPPIKYCVFIGGLRNPVDFALFYQTQYFCIYKLTVKRRKGEKINTLDLFLIKKITILMFILINSFYRRLPSIENILNNGKVGVSSLSHYQCQLDAILKYASNSVNYHGVN